MLSKTSSTSSHTLSSTEAELVGINDALSMILWMRNFLMDQGYTVTDNVIHQDNMSTMLLANNGRKSSGKRTRHIEIRYYFITDNINRGAAAVKYCPTEDMVADFFTKPLQGSQFRKLRNLILNYSPSDTSHSDGQECVGTCPDNRQTSPSTTNLVEVEGSIPQNVCQLNWAQAVRWSNRFRGDKGRTCKTTIDGTDYSIYEQSMMPGKQRKRGKTGRKLTWNPKWYSHKFEGPGVRYETALNIQTGDIVWTKGPFPCAKWPDAKIFQYSLQHKLAEDEMVEADGTYRGMPYHVRMPHEWVTGADCIAKHQALARHETIHRRLKTFNVLGSKFRHDLTLHKIIHQACTALIQLSIEHGEMVWHIQY